MTCSVSVLWPVLFIILLFVHAFIFTACAESRAHARTYVPVRATSGERGRATCRSPIAFAFPAHCPRRAVPKRSTADSTSFPIGGSTHTPVKITGDHLFLCHPPAPSRPRVVAAGEDAGGIQFLFTSGSRQPERVGVINFCVRRLAVVKALVAWRGGSLASFRKLAQWSSRLVSLSRKKDAFEGEVHTAVKPEITSHPGATPPKPRTAGVLLSNHDRFPPPTTLQHLRLFRDVKKKPKRRRLAHGAVSLWGLRKNTSRVTGSHTHLYRSRLKPKLLLPFAWLGGERSRVKN